METEEENKDAQEFREEGNQIDVKVGESEPVGKDVMSQVLGTSEEVIQATETIIEEGREEEGEETFGVDLSFPKILEAPIAEAKA